jgi:single-strand DNA-binding protein
MNPNNFTIIGRINDVWPAQAISDKFTKREFVLEIQDGKYPQQVKFQAVQDKVHQLDAFHVGQQVRVHFNLRGRAYLAKDGTTNYFTSLEAWRIEAEGNAETGNYIGSDPFANDFGGPLPAKQPAATQTGAFDDVPF